MMKRYAIGLGMALSLFASASAQELILPAAVGTFSGGAGTWNVEPGASPMPINTLTDASAGAIVNSTGGGLTKNLFINFSTPNTALVVAGSHYIVAINAAINENGGIPVITNTDGFSFAVAPNYASIASYTSLGTLTTAATTHSVAFTAATSGALFFNFDLTRTNPVQPGNGPQFFLNLNSASLIEVPELNAAAGMLPLALLGLFGFALFDRRRGCAIAG